MSRNALAVFLAISLLLVLVLPSLAADGQAFDRIRRLRMPDLTAEAESLLEKLYPDPDWHAMKFPPNVHFSKSAETGYRIAAKLPELLRAIPCYCYCNRVGHKNLLHCYLKEGMVGGEYDEHAVYCDICNAEAMLAFLWRQKAGATRNEILQGMEKKFERLVKKRGGTPAMR